MSLPSEKMKCHHITNLRKNSYGNKEETTKAEQERGFFPVVRDQGKLSVTLLWEIWTGTFLNQAKTIVK